MTRRNGAVRILLLRTRYAHWSRHAALNRYASSLAPRYRVDERLVHNGDEDFPIRFRLARLVVSAAVRTSRMPYYRLSDLAAETTALRDALEGRVDIVHYLDGEHGARYLPPLLRTVDRVRAVATYHQPPELLNELVLPRTVRSLDAVTVVAPHQVEWFARILGPERVRCILHPANTEFFRPPATRPAGEIFRCITVGHWLRDWEAIRGVARRLREREDVRFDLVTGGTTGLERLPNVTHHRGVSDEALLALYQRADLLFLPLVSATANNCLLEGIACGLPVVTTEMPATRAYLPGDAALFVEGNDPAELAEAILHLREEEALRIRMGKRAHARARELSWERLAPEYESLYDDLARA